MKDGEDMIPMEPSQYQESYSFIIQLRIWKAIAVMERSTIISSRAIIEKKISPLSFFLTQYLQYTNPYSGHSEHKI